MILNKTKNQKNEDDDNFIALIFKIPKLSLYMKSDQNCELWNFFKIWEIIENPQKNVYKTNIYICVFLSYFVFEDIFGVFNIRAKKLSSFSPIYAFSWLNRAISKLLRCKSPGQTAQWTVYTSRCLANLSWLSWFSGIYRFILYFLSSGSSVIHARSAVVTYNRFDAEFEFWVTLLYLYREVFVWNTFLYMRKLLAFIHT